MPHFTSSLLRTLIQALLLLGIYRAFDANAQFLRARCKTCTSIAEWFAYAADAYFFLSLAVLLLISLVAKSAFDQHVSANPQGDTLAVSAPPLNIEFFTLANDLASVSFFILLAIGVVLTDGVLESALAGLLTVSIIYSTTRLTPNGRSRRFRAIEIVAVVIIVVSGEFALASDFGSTSEFREAASLFDSSQPTKLLGYSTFTIAFSVIIAENWKLIVDAIRGT